MSTHRLDVSGARPLTTTTNDPAATVAQTPAKQGDDVTVTLGAKEIRVGLGEGARLERRRFVQRKQRLENGVHVKIDGEYQYDDIPYDGLVVVLGTSATLFCRTSFSPEEKAAAEADGRTLYEGHPHTSVVARRSTEPHHLEGGDLLESRDVREFLPALDRETLVALEPRGGSDEVGTPDTLTPKG